MGYNTIRLDLDGYVGRLTLNRPDRANSIIKEMTHELASAVETIRDANQLRVIVLTGAGKYFCAGEDIEEFKQLQSYPPAELEKDMRSFLETIGQIHRLPIPVVARVNGDAFGGGVGLALACDLRVMVSSARLGFIFARIGLTGSDAGVTYFLPRLIGPSRALEILLKGTVFNGETALREGLVHYAVGAEELDNVTNKITTQLASGPPIATRFTKEGVYASLARSLSEELDFEAHAQTICMMSADHKEGVKAFQEKRIPDFKGR